MTVLADIQERAFTIFIGVTFGKLWEPGDNILDELNRVIFYLKGRGILSYYVPKNPNKEIEPILNGELQRKFLLPKSEAQQQRNKPQSQTKPENWLKLGPKSKERARK